MHRTQVGVGEAAETMEEYGACQGAHNQELHVQVLECTRSASHSACTPCKYYTLSAAHHLPRVRDLAVLTGM